MKKSLKKILPWFVAAAIFYFLFKQIPPAQVFKTMLLANIPFFLFLAIVYFILIMILDCFGLKWAISRFSTKVTFYETILMRGATYVLMLINYNLGQGGMAFYLKRTHKAPVFKTLGTILYLTLVDLGLILTLGMGAVLSEDIIYRGVSLKPFLVRGTLLFYAFFIFIKIAPFRWLSERQILSALKESTLADYGKAVFFRLPVILTILFSSFFSIQAFHSHLPLTDIFAYSPVIMVAGTLPITPAGIGTVQALTIEFFQTHLTSPLFAQKLTSPAKILLASGLLWVFCNFALKALFGFFCIRKKSRALFEETPV